LLNFLKNKQDGFWWVLMAVYRGAQPDDKECFLAELVNSVITESLPLMVGVILILLKIHPRKVMVNLVAYGLPFLMHILSL
jgi:hypothetical protein